MQEIDDPPPYAGGRRKKFAILMLLIIFVPSVVSVVFWALPGPTIVDDDEPEFYDEDVYNIIGRFTVADTISEYKEITTVAAEYLRDKTADGGDT